MAEVLHHNKNANVEYVDGKSNEILSITKAEVYAVNWVDPQSRKQTLLAMVFGKMADGGPGVFIMAEPDQVRKTLTMPNTKFLKQFRQFLAARGPVDAEDLPPTIGMGEETAE